MREPFVLPDREYQRATRREMNVLQLLTALTSEVAFAQDDLKERLALVPDGQERMDDVLKNIAELYQDIIGAINTRQANQLLNVSSDMMVRLIPKMTPKPEKLQVSREEYASLIDCAREKCKFCTEDGESCVKCQLYGILIERVPLEEYDDGVTCPYAYTEWE